MIDKARELFRQDNYICFTSDLDWAPEAAIEETLEFYFQNGIHPTIFVTHPSKVVNKYKNKINLGIHPNFILPSSQGNSMEEIVEYCINLVPEAKVFRSHRWYSSNDIYDYLKNRGFLYESNICTNMDVLDPFIQRSGMLSFPVFFEDGAYIIYADKIDFRTVENKFAQKGLKVINIHPMHYALNTPYFKYTRQIKDRLTREQWNHMDKSTLADLRYKGAGITKFLQDLVYFANTQKVKMITLDQAYRLCMENN